MDLQPTPVDRLRELRDLLHQIVRRMTHRMFTTPRLTQIDVGNAIFIAQQVEYPKVSLVRKALPDLLRELGKKRPDLYRYVLVFEEAVRDLDDEIARAG